MATKPAVILEQTPTLIKVYWENITHADDGGAIYVDPRYHRKTILGIGTFAGGMSLALQGGMTSAGAAPCHSAGGSIAVGTAIALAAANACCNVFQNLPFYRLIRSSGSASDVDVYMICVAA